MSSPETSNQNSNQKSNFDEIIPVEIFFRIIEHTDHATLASMTLSSSNLRAFVKSNARALINLLIKKRLIEYDTEDLFAMQYTPDVYISFQSFSVRQITNHIQVNGSYVPKPYIVHNLSDSTANIFFTLLGREPVRVDYFKPLTLPGRAFLYVFEHQFPIMRDYGPRMRQFLAERNNAEAIMKSTPELSDCWPKARLDFHNANQWIISWNDFTLKYAFMPGARSFSVPFPKVRESVWYYGAPSEI